jgi:hypothetical protein
MTCDWDANVPDSTGEASPLLNGRFTATLFLRATEFELRFANREKSLRILHSRSFNGIRKILKNGGGMEYAKLILPERSK